MDLTDLAADQALFARLQRELREEEACWIPDGAEWMAPLLVDEVGILGSLSFGLREGKYL